MKKVLLISLFSAMAVGAYAQGTLVFSDRNADLVTHIYAPQADGSAQAGNAANDTPAGSTVYTGALLGGSSGASGGAVNFSFGNNFSVQIYAAPAFGDSVSSLLPVTQYLTVMRQTSQAAVLGTWITPSLASDPGVPGTPTPTIGNPNSAQATVAVAAWYNAGGTINSLADAQSAQVPWGESAPLNLVLGEAGASPPTFATELTGLTSFSLVQQVPEPSMIVLGVMGACAFLARRRKV